LLEFLKDAFLHLIYSKKSQLEYQFQFILKN
jgi:hypothetical protein